jgi:hypothetical protein
MVNLILPKYERSLSAINTKLDAASYTAYQLVRHEKFISQSDLEWLKEARYMLRRANELAKTLKHRHMHEVKYFSEKTPALYMASHQGVLDTFKDAYLFNNPLERHPLAFTTNFTLRAHHRGYNVDTFVLGTRLWHDIVKQLADATRFLLDDRQYAHLNLNPNTVLYDFNDGRIRCQITDYASIFPKNEIYESSVKTMPNFVYTLPYEKHKKESHAIAQLLSTLLELILFDLHHEKGFHIGDTKVPLVGYNIWHTVRAAILPHDATSLPPSLRPLRAIYDELRIHKMKRYEKNEHGMLALLFIATQHEDGEPDLDGRLKRLLNALCDNFKP